MQADTRTSLSNLPQLAYTISLEPNHQCGKLLRNLCPYTTYPTFSFPPTPSCISPSMNSSLSRTNIGTYPHLSPMAHPLRRNSNPFLDVFLFCFISLNLFCPSTGPLDCWSPFHFSYAFLFRFCSCSTFTMQHRLFIPFPLSVLYHSLFPFLIGSAMWKPTLSLT